LAVSAAAAWARIINVPARYSTIQAAIYGSVNGDTVLVAPGTYTENINFRGRQIVLASRYLLDPNPAFIRNTIINGSNPINPDTASCVIIASGEDSTTVLQGFTLTGGTGTQWVDEHGAGTYVEGGGILIQYSSPIIKNNWIVGNTAVRRPSGVTSAGGGAIRVGDSQPRILNNVIMSNSGMYGGGIVLNYTGAIVRNNIIARNTVYQAVAGAPTFGGGGIWISGNFSAAGKTIENNTIVGNAVSGTGGSQYAGRGGGIIVAQTAVTARNNIIWGNTQTTGSQLGVILSGTADVTYSDVEGGMSGTGNIDLNPQFADTSYYLPTGSPCIDAGDPSSNFNDPANPSNPGSAQFPSRGGLRNDMGTYGGPKREDIGAILTGVDDPGDLLLPHTFSLSQNYPNPFNPGTNITFVIPVGTQSRQVGVSLRVYDLLGRQVATLMEGERSPGSYTISWDARDMSSGVYLYRLSSGSFSSSRQMLLLK
jgi:hypothetical protein